MTVLFEIGPLLSLNVFKVLKISPSCWVYRQLRTSCFPTIFPIILQRSLVVVARITAEPEALFVYTCALPVFLRRILKI